MFKWIRERVKAAVLAGVGDAVRELNQETDELETIEYLNGVIEVRQLPALGKGKRGEK
jgi:hypothetical protein